MASPVSLNLGETLGFNKFNIGLGTFGNVLMLIIILFIIFGGIAAYIIFYYWRKQYKYKIHLFSKIGNTPTRIATYKAKPISLGKAGDKIWFVSGVKKFIPPATFQSASNEYWFWQREDGEWINFHLSDIEEQMKKANALYVHQDMRMSRVAIERNLENRLMDKTFWEKWGAIIGYAVFFLLITICLVIFMFQYSKTVDKLGHVISIADEILEKANTLFEPKPEGSAALVPVSILLMMGGRRWDL